MSEDKGVLLEVGGYPESGSEYVVDATQSGRVAVTVVFTTEESTLQALREVGRLAAQLRASVRVLVLPCSLSA